MKCPHCAVEIHPAFSHEWIRGGTRIGVEKGLTTNWATESMECPACVKAIVVLLKGSERVVVYPKSAGRLPAPLTVPPDQAEDYNEACMVLLDSPKASAALSRRCLQALLNSQGFKHNDLAKAIDAVLVTKALPSSLAENLDAIRNTGNFAAHPMKDTNSGAILPVEPHEAEWNLEVLEGLFDFYYVQPAKDQARRLALNAKLGQAGKPALKQ